MNDRLKEQIAKWAERFESFSLRERVLMAGALVVMIFMVWDAMVMSPEGVKQKNIVNDMHDINQQMEKVSQQIGLMTAKLRDTESEHLMLRIKEVKTLLNGLRQQQQNLTVQFIPPKQMAAVLRDMLNAEKGLVLMNLESLGAEPLFPQTEEDRANENQVQRRPAVFKHGIRIVFEGDYFKTLNYLQALEAMPWVLYWDNVDYQVLKYPKARVVITVHTLSLNKGWIGV